MSLYNSHDGIYLYESNNNIIAGNTANNNDDGIYLDESKYNTITGNNMTHCGVIIWGVLEQASSHNIDITNLVNGKPVYYYANEIGLGAYNFTYAGDAGQVILANCRNSNISNLNLSDTTIGILLLDSNNNMISGNTANNNSWTVIELLYSDKNTITGNNGDRIYLHESNYNTITGNNCDMINLVESNYNTITGNTINYGIYIYRSKCNEISDNSFAGNNENIQGTQEECPRPPSLIEIVIEIVIPIVVIAIIIMGIILINKRKEKRGTEIKYPQKIKEKKLK